MVSGTKSNRKKVGSEEEEVTGYLGEWKGCKNTQNLVECRGS